MVGILARYRDRTIPSGKQPHNYGKSLFFIGKFFYGHFLCRFLYLFVCLPGRVYLSLLKGPAKVGHEEETGCGYAIAMHVSGV